MSNLVIQTDEEAYADFAKRYGSARSDYDLARILSGRLRDLDKRTRAANKRADALERENETLRGAISWIEMPFVDANTPENELRQRVAFVVADAARAGIRDAKERKE